MKFSIITPAYNSEQFIAETIESVINQKGNFSIEYIILDNCSTDETISIAKSYQHAIETGARKIHCRGIQIIVISESDFGMYDALNKGFLRASGDIYAWINSDDIYLPGAFAIMAKVFDAYKNVDWLKGITSYITKESTVWQVGLPYIYAQTWIQAGVYGREKYFIQQDSTFWRSHLWDKVGKIDTNYKRAGDYWLWARFAEVAPLVTVRALVSCFRHVAGQISEDHEAYMKEVKNFKSDDNKLGSKVKFYSYLEYWIPRIIRPFLFRCFFGRENFSLVLINAKGELSKIDAEYYYVRQNL